MRGDGWTPRVFKRPASHQHAGDVPPAKSNSLALVWPSRVSAVIVSAVTDEFVTRKAPKTPERGGGRSIGAGLEDWRTFLPF